MKAHNFTAFLITPIFLTGSIAGQKDTSASVNGIRTLPTAENSKPARSNLVAVTTTPTTYYVSASGNDSNNGISTSTPFRTIQRAADLTNPGDTVLIMNGLYTNPHPGYVFSVSRSGNANRWIRFKAYPGHLPKLKHNAWNGILIANGASYIEIDGLEIEGNNANISLNYALSQKNNLSNPLTIGNCITVDGRSNGYVRHIRITNNKIHGCGGGGIAVIQADYLTVDRNEVYNNAWYSPYGNSGISIYQAWNSDSNQGYKIFVTNNKVYNNRQYIPFIFTGKIEDGNGIIIDDLRNTQGGSTLSPYQGRTLVSNNLTYKNGGTGIHTHLCDRVDIFHNTAYLNNQSPEISHGQIFANASSNVRIWNNIFYAYPGKNVNNNWNNTNVTYNNNIYANSSLITGIGANNIIADPQFVNASLDDFRLNGTSPAINNGYTWSASGYLRTQLTKDIVNNPRPAGTKFDIGAYEYQF
jgi:hypothetical protein